MYFYSLLLLCAGDIATTIVFSCSENTMIVKAFDKYSSMMIDNKLEVTTTLRSRRHVTFQSSLSLSNFKTFFLLPV